MEHDRKDPDGILGDGVRADPAAPRLPIYTEGRAQLAAFEEPILIHADHPHERLFIAALDGVAHTAKVDIGAIFKDERVLYNVPDAEIPDRSWGGEPGILLEVNDRTISVYMKAFIATKTEQIPGNKDSDFRDDVIMAWTHTY
jgi:hypothetical protein